MPRWLPVPLSGPVYQNVDDFKVDGLQPLVDNIIVDEANFSRKRAGLDPFVDLETMTGVDGLYWWHDQGFVLAVSNGHVWRITDQFGTKEQVTSGDTLLIGNQVTIDHDGVSAYLANGTRILRYVPGSPAAYLADPDAPTVVTHVAFLDQYILAGIVGSGSWQFSEIGVGTDWREVDLFTAETKPDVLSALKVAQGEILLAGPNSIEFWANDGTSPFSRIPGTALERGLGATYSLSFLKDRWAYLDQDRNLVEIVGRTPSEASIPVNQTIQNLTSIADAVGQLMTVEGYPLYVITFPSNNRTFVYNFLKKDWSEWNYWNSITATETRFRGNAYCYARDWNLHLIGDYANGKIYSAKPSAFSDDGEVIRVRRRSGVVTHGTSAMKESQKLRIYMKRGVATESVPNPQVMLRWRDNQGAWSNEHWRSLGQVGQHRPYVEWSRLGKYRQRQYEVICTDAVEFSMGRSEELVEVLP